MLNKIKKTYEENKVIYISFLLAAAICVIVYITLKIHPFGNQNLLRIDLFHQYAPFHEELRDKMLNGGSFFYSWSSGLGKNFLSQIAYYTSSPLNIILIFFKQSQIAEFIAVSILLKISFASAFFAYYLKRIYQKDDLHIVIFSLGYACSAFVMAYYWNLMWLDAVALFPLVACGMELILRENKYKTYLFSLAILIISNFYIGFITCIFTALYFIVLLFSRYSIKDDFAKIFKKSLMFGLASVLAGALAAFLLLPTFLTLQATATSAKNAPTDWKIYFDILAYYPTHFMGVMPKVLVKNESLPNAYPGILTMILLPFYFTNRHFKTREKILHIALLVFMFLGFYLNKLDFLLHGNHFPANLPHRYSFIYIFILITLAYKAFRFKDKIYLPGFITMNVLSLAYIFIYGFKVTPIEEFKKYFRAGLFLNLIFILLYSIIFIVDRKSKIKKRILLYICVVVVFLESGISLGIGMHFTGTQDRENYISRMKGYNLLEDKYIHDDSLYRSEFSSYNTLNDGSLMHYNGLSTFSSTANGDTAKMFEHLGVPSTGNSYRYADTTTVIDAFFAIKYLCTLSTAEIVGYERIADEENVFLHKNENPLSFGFLVKEDILNWDYGNKNPFKVQNDLVKKASNLETDVFTDGIIIQDYTSNNITLNGDLLSGQTNVKVTDVANMDSVPNINMNLYTQDAGEMMFYIYAPNAKSVQIKIGDSERDESLSTGKGLIDLGYQAAGETINLNFDLDRRGMDEPNFRAGHDVRIFPVFYNHNNFLEAYDVLADGNMDIYEYSDKSIKATIQSDEDKVLFTSIPYDEGWEILIDGEAAEKVSIANNALLAIKISEGYHELEFNFVPRGFMLGIKITAGALILLIAITILEIALKKKGYFAKIEEDAYDDFIIKEPVFVDFESFIEDNFGEPFEDEMNFEMDKDEKIVFDNDLDDNEKVVNHEELLDENSEDENISGE